MLDEKSRGETSKPEQKPEDRQCWMRSLEERQVYLCRELRIDNAG
jgi:hypothetical protein